MLTLGTYELTHPETLTKDVLQEIMENTCIDFSAQKDLSRTKLMELYKRVAMPLPRRQNNDNENSDTKKHNEEKDSVDKQSNNSDSLNGGSNVSRDTNKVTKTKLDLDEKRHKSPVYDCKQISKPIYLDHSNNISRCNSSKRKDGGKLNFQEVPRKKQKITWP